MSAKTDDSNWLEACLAAVPAARVAVFGDFCVDAYWLIDTDEGELSVETGLPVRRVRQQRYSLGGAGNIVANLAALGVKAIHAVGLVGSDMFGGQMLQLLNSLGVQTSGMLTCQGDWQTLVYSKPCIGEAEANRIDFGGFNALADASIADLASQLDRVAGQADIVILNQQVPSGVATPKMIAEINRIVAAHPTCRFIVDSRHRAELYQSVMLKLNSHEALRLLGRPRPLDERVSGKDARAAAGELFQRNGRTVFVTRGENGILVADASGVQKVPGIQILERTDPVGAGDTVLSAIAAALAGGCEALSAAKLANIAASITVRKLQTTGTASPEEIRSVGAEPDYVYLPELADDARQARFVADSEIEIIRDIPAGLNIRHAIFDHDGTISTLRQGWEAIMEPVMVRAILGKRYQDAEEGLYHKVVDCVRHLIDKTTGIQTITQMQKLVGLVNEFGVVPPRERLDMYGYKALFARELLALVASRVAKLHRGELESADFQIKGALPVLQALRQRGVTLYLASGTDQDDVRTEAKELGYADLFTGGIYGSVGDVNVEAKAEVIKGIIGKLGLQGSQLATFGDGPVEMRLTRKVGGLAVGIASDEIRRFGMNASKRARLIRSGADIVVPDFSQGQQVLKLLFPNA